MIDHERTVELAAGNHRARFDLDHGARLASLLIDGEEFLVGPETDDRAWGSYPMAPWAGRIRHGVFRHEGVRRQLPIDLPPHAIHGTAYTASWRREGSVMVLDLTDPWPFPGRLEQRATLDATGLEIELSITAGERSMPAMLGWHPWFRRRIRGVEARLEFESPAMYELDDEMIPTGRIVEPPPGPWDNTFVDLAAGPVIEWAGLRRLRLSSDCRFWTIYTEPSHALCVEPQTEAPDVFNREPGPDVVLGPGETMRATFGLDWGP